jgi:hypothetical protein
MRKQAADGKLEITKYDRLEEITKQIQEITSNHKNVGNEEKIKDLLEANLIKVDKIETKSINWTYPHEHKEGILTKPCEICGYKYGSAWLHENVPEEILMELKTM